MYAIVYIKLSIVATIQKGRPGVVVRAVSLSHQVVCSKQPLRRFARGRLASVFPFPRPHSRASGTGSALLMRYIIRLNWE